MRNGELSARHWRAAVVRLVGKQWTPTHENHAPDVYHLVYQSACHCLAQNVYEIFTFYSSLAPNVTPRTRCDEHLGHHEINFARTAGIS